MADKFFVIGGYYILGYEVFDSSTRKFTSITSSLLQCMAKSKAICVGDKIMVFSKPNTSVKTKVFIYDVLNDSWSEKKIEIINDLIRSSYIKYNS